MSSLSGPARLPSMKTLRVLTPGVIAVGNRLAAAAAGFAMTTVFARVLPLSQFGALSAVIAWLNVVIVAGMLGHEQWSTRHAVLAPGSRAYRRLAYGSVAAAGLGAALAMTGLLRTLQPQLAAFAPLLLVAPLVALTRVEQGLVRGHGAGEWAGLPDGLVRPVLTLLATLAAARLLAPEALPLAVMVAWGVAALAALLLAQGLRRSRERHTLATRATSAGTAVPAAAAEPPRFSASTWFASLLSVATNQIPLICVAALATRDQAGLYAAADRFGALVAMLPQALYQARAGSLAAAHHAGGEPALAREFMQVTRSGATIAIPACLVLLVFAPWLLSAFGHDFTAATAVLRVAASATLVIALAGPLGTALIMSGHARENSQAMVVGGIAQAGLSLWLVPMWGALGAAVGVLGATITWNLLLMHRYRAAFGRLPYSWRARA